MKKKKRSYSHLRAEPRSHNPTLSQPKTHTAKVPHTASDGYANAAAFLGEESELISAGTFYRSNLTSDAELLTVAYRESWLAKRIIDMPSEDMTRAWYNLSSSLEKKELRRLKLLEARHSVKQEITNAIRWARLYGGSLALMVIRGEEDSLDQPLDQDLLLPDCFQGLLVLDRAQGIEPSAELVTDLDDPDFGLPAYYTAELNLDSGNSGANPTAPGAGSPAPYRGPRSIRIHHSRVLRFVGRELPQREMERENFWGASELEHIWEELQKRSAASANIAQLIFQANITTLKMSDFGEMMAVGTEEQKRQVLDTIRQENRFRTSFGLQMLSAGDTLENHSYSFAGLSEIYESFMMDMAGAAEIPATKLFGRSPQGMNATGESDLRNYYEMIAQLQERMLRPALEKLLPVMAISCWGYAPEDMEIVFQPVMTTSAMDRAELAAKLSESVISAFQAGLITREEAVEELANRGVGLGVWTKIGADGAMPEDEGKRLFSF